MIANVTPDARPAGLGRRAALLATVAGLAWLSAFTACSPSGSEPDGAERMIVLGFDGMDYEITRRLMDEGRLPNMARLAYEGAFQPLETAIPPQSPVAWSDFITGLDSGGHGIFDFIHRESATRIPYQSTSTTTETDTLEIGSWCIPYSGGETVLLRRGRPFWEALEESGTETTIVRMPANYPPSGSATRELSGMGTPDFLGTYGTFSFFTTDASRFSGKRITGGRVQAVVESEGKIEMSLEGPGDPIRCEGGELEAELVAHLDPRLPRAKIVVSGRETVLDAGQWSDWVPVTFSPLPLVEFGGMVRFYLRSVRPEFELYATPINFDPIDPAATISTPDGYARELAEASGRFFTQGMPEDTKALTEEVLSVDEFLAQAEIAGREIRQQYEHVLSTFDRGFLFYYFGNLDQISHVMFRTSDPGHPAYDAEIDGPYAGTIESLYEEMDEVVGYTLEKMGENVNLVIMSDHGFTSWRRAFNLNTWLYENGYLAMQESYFGGREDNILTGADWGGTRAYGLGINGLYLNLAGREPGGIVPESERDALLAEIKERLLATVDPATGLPAVTQALTREEAYAGRDYIGVGPDLVVGYAEGTRCSNASVLGGVPDEVIVDNTDDWSGDHCMDHRTVPGILLTSRPLEMPVESLRDLSAAIVAEFGATGFPRAGEGDDGDRPAQLEAASAHDH